MVMSPAGHIPEKDCTGKVQQQLKITDPSSCRRGHPVLKRPQLSKDDLDGREREIGRWSHRVA
jgi:hypothetical protein